VGDGVAAVSGGDSALGVGDDGVTVGSTVGVGDETVAGGALAAGEEVVGAAAGSAATPLDGAGDADPA
jgi:hypothetical protein